MARTVSFERFVRLKKKYETLQKKARNLQEIASRDLLTGLCTRDEFYRLLTRHIFSLGRSRQKNRSITIMMVDLDHFKRVNDTYGHAAGDILLKNFGQHLLKNGFRENDIFSRYGGEEFLIALPGATPKQILTKLGKKGVRPARIPPISVMFNGVIITATASGGVVPFLLLEKMHSDETLRQRIDRSIYDAYQRADRAAYKAKAAGRNMILPGE